MTNNRREKKRDYFVNVFVQLRVNEGLGKEYTGFGSTHVEIFGEPASGVVASVAAEPPCRSICSEGSEQ